MGLVKKQSSEKISTNHSVETPAEVLVSLIELMQSVSVDTQESVLNISSISDGRGGRILL